MTAKPKKVTKEPPLGSILYEVGFKQEEPAAPIIISYVYCGRVMDQGQEVYLLVEFWKWWNKNRLGLPIESNDGLKVPSIQQLVEGRENWTELCVWIRKCSKDWRKEMEK